MNVRQGSKKLFGDYFDELLADYGIFNHKLLKSSSRTILSDDVIILLCKKYVKHFDYVRVVKTSQDV